MAAPMFTVNSCGLGLCGWAAAVGRGGRSDEDKGAAYTAFAALQADKLLSPEFQPVVEQLIGFLPEDR